MQNNHGSVFKICYGYTGISQPGVNVINGVLPVTEVAHGQYIGIESLIFAELIRF